MARGTITCEIDGTEPMRSSEKVPWPILEMISVRSSTFL
jgi:hypothetical protein